MNEKLIMLQRKRGSAIKQADDLLTRARTEVRELTTDEARTFDSLMGSLDGITDALKALDPRHGDLPVYNGNQNRSGFLNLIKSELDRPLDVQVDLNSEVQERAWAGALRDETTGRELRGYRHGERISEDQGGGNPNVLGMLIRDKCLGTRTVSPELRQVQVDQDVSGGFLLSPFGSGNVWDLARAASVVSAAGAITIPVNQREFTLGKVTADPTASWVPEGGSIALDESMRFGAVKVRGRKLAMRIEITDEMIKYGNSAQLITQTCATAIAQEMDRAALDGGGNGEEPCGILSTTGIQTSAASPAAITFDQMIDVHTALQTVNAQPNAFIIHPTMNGNLAKIKDGEGQYFSGLPGDLQQVRKHVTSKTDDTVFLMGEFKNLLIIPNSSGVEIDLVKDVVSGRGCWLMQLIVYMDVACVWPNRFYALTGVNG